MFSVCDTGEKGPSISGEFLPPPKKNVCICRKRANEVTVFIQITKVVHESLSTFLGAPTFWGMGAFGLVHLGPRVAC